MSTLNAPGRRVSSLPSKIKNQSC